MWIPITAWAVGAVLAVVVLGFASYEIWWKAGRLQGDVQRMLALRESLTGLQDDLLAAQERIANIGSAPVDDSPVARR
jgi:hypothetical protein